MSQFEYLFYKKDEPQLERFLEAIVSVKKKSLKRKGRKLNLAPKSGIFLTGKKSFGPHTGVFELSLDERFCYQAVNS